MSESVFHNKSVSLLCVGLVALIGLSVMLRTIHAADFEGSFIDEQVNVQAGYHFFTQGNYTSNIIGGLFPPGITTGMATTWVSGIVFLLGGSLFHARLALAGIIYLQAGLLSFFIVRRYDGSRLSAAALGVVLLAVLTRWVPFCWGFIQSLGELQGALLIAWCLFFLPRRPHVAFLCLGASVWGCKFIYLPTALIILGLYSATAPGTVPVKTAKGRCSRLLFCVRSCCGWL
jgi:hypothetical protein